VGCAGCGIRIPPAGSFGAGSQVGPGIPPEGSIGTVLGAGAISTDTRVGGSGLEAATAISPDWYRSPIALVLIVIVLALFVRRVLE
jgi:hypothetical protein